MRHWPTHKNKRERPPYPGGKAAFFLAPAFAATAQDVSPRLSQWLLLNAAISHHRTARAVGLLVKSARSRHFNALPCGAAPSLLTRNEYCLRGTRRKCPRGKQSTRTPVMVITDALRGGVYFMMGWLVCACAQVKRGGAATWG